MFKITRTYRKWDSMIARCHRPSHPAFKYYGGRGITVCDKWRNDFSAFLADMGEAPPGLWLDRIDNAKGYEPGNCRWVTPSESARNRRPRPQVPGSIRQRARVAGMDYVRVIQRVAMGWPLDKALTVPIQKPGGMSHAKREQYGLPHGEPSYKD